MRLPKIAGVTFCLVASTLANPVVHRNQNGGQANRVEADAALQAKVQGTINQWLGDINTVNNFVDTVGNVKDLAQISQLAATAFKAAQNEGTSNAELQQDVPLGSQGQAAADALVGQFNIIGPAINDTITNPGNLQKNLDAINGARYDCFL